MAKPNTYEVELLSSGKVDVLRNRRAWKYDLDDLDEAVRVIMRAEGRGFEFTVIELDGYRRKAST